MSTERVIGYVLVDPNTHELDWDGLIHETRDGAIEEAVAAWLGDNPIEHERPIDGCDQYQVMAVSEDIGLDAAVLAAAQKRWDDEAAYWAKVAEDA